MSEDTIFDMSGDCGPDEHERMLARASAARDEYEEARKDLLQDPTHPGAIARAYAADKVMRKYQRDVADALGRIARAYRDDLSVSWQSQSSASWDNLAELAEILQVPLHLLLREFETRGE